MKRFLWSMAITAGLAAPSVLFAQTTAESSVEVVEAPAVEEAYDPNTGALTFTGGVDWTTAYFFRGYNQEDQGLIFQPYGTITVPVMTKDNYTLNGYIGTWNSFQNEKTGASGSGPSTWYESDLFGGLDLVMGKFTIGTVYTFYTYPNGAFQDIQEIGFKVGYDDTDFMKEQGMKFALKPYAAAYFETSDGNGTQDSYLELGVAPSFGIGESGWTLSVPVVLGFSIDDYYLDDSGDNEFLGYSSVGIFGSTPLKIPSKYGAWTLTAGVTWLQLYADSVQNTNNGDETEFVGKVGVSFAY